MNGNIWPFLLIFFLYVVCVCVCVPICVSCIYDEIIDGSLVVMLCVLGYMQMYVLSCLKWKLNTCVKSFANAWSWEHLLSECEQQKKKRRKYKRKQQQHTYSNQCNNKKKGKKEDSFTKEALDFIVIPGMLPIRTQLIVDCWLPSTAH